MTATTTTSLLSRRDRETLDPRSQARKLARIAKRALDKADWYAELADRHEATLDLPDFWTAEEVAAGARADCVAEIVGLRTDRGPLIARSVRACDEIERIAAAAGMTVRELAR